MPTNLPPLNPRPNRPDGSLPPLSPRPDRTRELPTIELPPPPRPQRQLGPPPPRPSTPPPAAARTRGRRTLATATAVVVAAGIAGAASARLFGPEASSPVVSPPVAQTGGGQSQGLQDTGLADAVKVVQSAVVEVRTRTSFGGSQGSGVIVAGQGLIVTNNHVIDGASRVEVISASGESIGADVVRADPSQDLAILRPDTSPGPGVTLAEDAVGPPAVGETVFAIGAPFGLQNTVTSGIVSAYRPQDGVPYIQFDAPVNPGNSGGGLFDLQGQLIGIPTKISSPVAGNVGIGFAIPATRVRALLAQVS